MVRVADAIDAATDAIGRVAAWTCLALVLVMAGNVLLRYGFATGSVWAQELEWHLMSPIALIGMSYALRHGEHVRVDVLFARFQPRTQAAIDVLSAALGIAVALIVIQLSLGYVGQSFAQNEGSANPGGIPYRYLLKALIPIGFALLALQSVSTFIRAAQRLRAA
jgi:TRAP-type mannitol/chloroaromatic compound transport system permease small subunit